MFANLTPWGSLELQHQKHPVASVAHEQVRICPIKSSICPIDPDSNVGSRQDEWRRKANTGPESMDLQCVFQRINTRCSTTLQRRQTLSFLPLVRTDVIPAGHMEENLYISGASLHLMQRQEAMESTAQE